MTLQWSGLVKIKLDYSATEGSESLEILNIVPIRYYSM